MSFSKVFRVNASALNLRAQPSTSAGILTVLRNGQAVARLDDLDHEGWWFVFADTPGDGLYVGYAYSRFLSPVTAPGFTEAPDTAPLPPDEDEEADISPPREPDGDAPGDSISDVAAPPPPPVQWENGWHPEIPAGRRHDSPNKGARRDGATPNRIVIHITGTDSLQVVMNRFMNASQFASAHYLVMPDGALHQFVSEEDRAWHSGIQRYVRALYDRNDGSWRGFKRYFSWSSYPPDAVFLDENMELLGSRERDRAKLVMPGGAGEWPDYQWFDQTWGRASVPLGYAAGNRDPNNASIGIEVLSYGSVQADPEVYTSAMYTTLSGLVGDICQRYAIPRTREFICGHEDVNPVERWGWDPNRGFEWDRVLSPGSWG